MIKVKCVKVENNMDSLAAKINAIGYHNILQIMPVAETNNANSYFVVIYSKEEPKSFHPWGEI